MRLSHLLLLFLPLMAVSADLRETFTTPHDSTRTKVWWFHGETITTREGIDADLQAFRDKGVGGVVFYDQIHGIGVGAFSSMSPEWWEMLKYAAAGAKKLGLSFEVAVGNGYVTGGPWITPELSMKKTAMLDTIVSLDSPSDFKVDFPDAPADFNTIATVIFPDSDEYSPLSMVPEKVFISSNDTIITFDATTTVDVRGISYDISPRGKGSTGSMNIPGPPRERYFGAKYVEYPSPGELEYSTDGKTWATATHLLPVESNIGHKSRRRTISFPGVSARHFRLRIHDWDGNDPEYKRMFIENVVLHRRDIVDNIEVKTGLRTEVTYPSVTGGEAGVIAASKIRDISADSTLRLQPGSWHIVRLGWVPTGARTKHGRRNLLGREADVMSEIAASTHYDHYFKAILDTLSAAGTPPAGMVMDSHEAGIQNWTKGLDTLYTACSGRDFTSLVPAFAGVIVDSRIDTDSRLRDFRRLISQTISDRYYGTLASRCVADGVEFTSQSMLNIAADNILNRSNPSKPQGEFWAYQTDGNYDCLDAASSAHLYGHNIASAEAFTDTPYSSTWDELLRIANIAYCRGINEFVVCASSYQPWMDHPYDDSASSHPYVFHRFHPEWESSGPFWDYQARCASMLRQGVPVVDLCVYIGEEPPLKTLAYKLPVIPQGHNFDVFTLDALLNRMHADNGEVAVDGGMRYKAVIVQDRTYVSPEAEDALLTLEREGVPVVWCNKGETPSERLPLLGVKPDIEVSSNGEPDDTTLFFHRSLPEADVYFIYNHSHSPLDSPLSLRTGSTRMERWNPADGTMTPLYVSAPGSTQLTLSPHEAAFVVAF
ncbi:MAG: glycosyl hydrolase family 2 [Muribaculaceae bacterium]|nr:glycosyl hydrolase family 2 [Muribaculaceae bacterium]